VSLRPGLLSVDTFAEEIVDPRASRVLLRSAFGYGHDPDAASVVAAAVFVAVALFLRPQPAVVVLPPQAATSTPAAMSRTRLSAARLLKLVLISLLRALAVVEIRAARRP
jgi:hypothetical protein